MGNNHELNEIFKVQIYFPKVWKINKYIVYLWSVFFVAVSLPNGMFTLFMNIFRGCFHTCMAAFIMKILSNDIAHIKYKCFEMVNIKPLMRFQTPRKPFSCT